MHSKTHWNIPNKLLHKSKMSMTQLDQKSLFFSHAVKVISGIDEFGIHRSIISWSNWSMISFLIIVRTVFLSNYSSLQQTLYIIGRRSYTISKFESMTVPLLFDGYIHYPIGYAINTPCSSLHSGTHYGLFGFTVSYFGATELSLFASQPLDAVSSRPYQLLPWSLLLIDVTVVAYSSSSESCISYLVSDKRQERASVLSVGVGRIQKKRDRKLRQ